MKSVESAPRPTELQFQILNVMMDDAEDVEQIYLAANRRSLETGSIQPEYPLGEIVDELGALLRRGYVEAPKFCNESSLPQPPDSSLLHHYWFSPTEKGKQVWEAYRASPPGVQG
jgi:hypothetical protein